ncbi:hypothetical protein [Desulfosporosinus sp. FKB]|uniref:hypothetical protein n=1 Tax=Desulfosporosinus sp. FKB TaxID=1969835 RepID=UPI001482516B|nr:hypothetical protein [Desulfosporosinus sp. FKB]
MTQARGLYVSSPANFRSSDRPQIRGGEQGCSPPPWRQGRRLWHDNLRWRLSPKAGSPKNTIAVGCTPLPKSVARTVSLLCACTDERCVIQVRY